MRYIIQDWAGNRVWPDQTFDSFESGWDWIYASDPEPDPASVLWKDGWYDDYYVLPLHECKCESGSCAYHAGYQDAIRDATSALVTRFNLNVDL
jgi:hypothetical protein